MSQKIKEKLYFYYYDLLTHSEKERVEELLKNPQVKKEFKLISDRISSLRNKNKVDISPELESKILAESHMIFARKEGALKRINKTLAFKLALASLVVLLVAFVFYNNLGDNTVGFIRITNRIILDDTEIKRNQKLRSKVRIIIPSDSKAIIQKKGIYFLELHGNTVFFIERQEEDSYQVSMDQGKTYFKVDKEKKKMTIETFNTIIKIVGTEFELYANQQMKRTMIKIIEGILKVYNKSRPEGQIMAEAGQTVIIDRDKDPQITQPKRYAPSDPSNIELEDRLKEKITMKNGHIYIGYIILQTDKKIIIQTEKGKITLGIKDIMKIEYILREGSDYF
ncbi:MAG: FecR domain-containing protein [Spirochaetes bacterium]|nr:FecR domain-containing protein [Spirochaetota bacterium]